MTDEKVCSCSVRSCAGCSRSGMVSPTAEMPAWLSRLVVCKSGSTGGDRGAMPTAKAVMEFSGGEEIRSSHQSG